MSNTMYRDTKQEILESTFSYLIEQGLENIRIRDLCKYIGLTEGTLYYWYKNKDELICAAAEYGLKKMSDDIFDYFFKNVMNIDKFFNECLNSIDYVKKELRFIYQMASSPVYGEKMRKSSNLFVYAYDEYAKKLVSMAGGDISEIKPIIHIFAASIVDYAVWQNKSETQIQLDYIHKKLKEALNI